MQHYSCATSPLKISPNCSHFSPLNRCICSWAIGAKSFKTEKGYAVQSAYTGPDGLKVTRQWRPDVVLLDIGLPGLDGYEVARRLRTVPLDEAHGGETFQGRIIAVTGYDGDSDIARAREAGFDAHLVKPYEFDELEKLMTSACK